MCIRDRVGIVRNMLHIIHVFQPMQEFFNLQGHIAGDRDVVIRTQADLGQIWRQPCRFHRRLHIGKHLCSGEHIDCAIFRIHHDIVGAGFNCGFGDGVLIGTSVIACLLYTSRCV